MRSGILRTALVLAAVGAAAGLTAAAGAPGAAGAERLASRTAADVVLVAEGDVVADDLYAVGQVIVVNGTVEGDLLFWAGDRLEINGEVTGDVTGVAGRVRINGRVGGSVRAAGWDVAVGGEVAGDLLGVGWRVAAGGEVGRDVLAWARNLAATGAVGRDIAGQAWGTALLSGRVGRDVEITVDRLRAGAGAEIAEDLVYRSPRPAEISPQATVGGNLIRRNPLLPNLSVRAARTSVLLAAWLTYILAGLLFIRSSRCQEAAARLRARPWHCLGMGSVLLAGAPLLAAASLWAVIAFAGWNLWMLLGIALIGSLLFLAWGGTAVAASVPSLVAAGRWLSRGRLGPYGAFAATAPAAGALTLLPYYIGAALLLAAALFGAGAVIGRSSARLTPGRSD